MTESLLQSRRRRLGRLLTRGWKGVLRIVFLIVNYLPGSLPVLAVDETIGDGFGASSAQVEDFEVVHEATGGYNVCRTCLAGRRSASHGQAGEPGAEAYQ